MSIFDQISGRKFLIICALATVLLYVFYLDGIGKNPPGFYLDESFISYQAYLISQTGRNEYGELLPTYFPAFQKEDGTFDGYANPTYIYALATLNLFFPPSISLSKTFSATVVFLACFLLGRLASRISGRPIVGVIIATTALLTPWFFELSRLVFEVALYPLAVLLFLIALFEAQRARKWSLIHCLLVAGGLALVTYTYSIGRLLGPVFAVGLFLFVTDKLRLTAVLKTFGIYALMLLPTAVFVLRNPGVFTQRYDSVSQFKEEMSFAEKILTFGQSYFTDIGFENLLFSGDPFLRHHIPGMGMLFAASLLIGLIGLIFALMRARKDPWYRFLIFGSLVSVIPAALTLPRTHMLRLITFPIFLFLLGVPALAWLIGGRKENSLKTSAVHRQDLEDVSHPPYRFGPFLKVAKITALIIIVGSIVIQAVQFQTGFRERGPARGYLYDDSYPFVLAEAIATESRPIYLEDGFWGPAYIHAYWYGTIQGVDPLSFVHLSENERPPEGAVVLSSNHTCSRCEIVARRGNFLLYKTIDREGVVELPTQTVGSGLISVTETVDKSRSIALVATRPRGIAVDANGNIYIADSGNSRIQKLSSTGDILATIGKAGTADGELREPNGVAVDAAGNIYVTDGSNIRLIKFKADGTYVKQWNGPEPGFDAVSDVVIGMDKQLYVADKGRSRIVKLDPETGNISEWGRNGIGDGQFNTLTGIASGGNRVFASDAVNDRVQVFDLDGNFISQWAVPHWDKYIWHRPDVAVDLQAKLVYVTSGWTHEVLVFDMEGNFLKSLAPAPPAALNNPSSLVLSDTKSGKYLYVLNTGSDVVETGNPSVTVFELSNTNLK